MVPRESSTNAITAAGQLIRGVGETQRDRLTLHYNPRSEPPVWTRVRADREAAQDHTALPLGQQGPYEAPKVRV